MKYKLFDVACPSLQGIFLVAALCLSALPSFAGNAGQAEWCKTLSPRLPGLSMASCQASGLTPTGATSVNGFPILSRRIPATTAGHAKPIRVLLLGGIHGDELTASSIVFQWMQWMKRPIAQSFEWHIVPVLNPDGMLARKPSRMNAHGVDLNRNFPTPGWEKEAPQYWHKATRSDPRRYPGPTPLSEPETRWVNDEIARFQPDVIISVHAPFGVLDFDGPVNPPNRFGRLVFDPVGVYPGSLGNYSGVHKKVPVITIELPNARAMPARADVQRIWADMLTWIQLHVPKQALAAPAMQPAALQVAKEKTASPQP